MEKNQRLISLAEIKPFLMQKYDALMPKFKEIDDFKGKTITEAIEWGQDKQEQIERKIYLRAISDIDTDLEKYFNGIIFKARSYAYHCHSSTNHFYDKILPYSYHLEMVESYASKYIDLIPENDREDVIAACMVHDVIEDCRQTYNDVKRETNELVADISYAVTNLKGKDRRTRGGDEYYKGIREHKYATFVKLCDRMANMMYSYERRSSMHNKYKLEYPNFKEKLYDPKYSTMFDFLDQQSTITI